MCAASRDGVKNTFLLLKGTLFSWIVDVYTLVHNYWVLGYKINGNYNSWYAWKLPGVNTTSELIPDNKGNIRTNTGNIIINASMITIWNSGHNSTLFTS